jgi:hypothetical protein
VVTADTRPIVYLDETCPSHSGKDYNGLKVPDGKGGRVTILHAVHSGGWVNNCAYIRVQGEVNSRDYHNKMNTKHFMQWFTNSLLPSRPPSAEIVLETAKYGAQK